MRVSSKLAGAVAAATVAVQVAVSAGPAQAAGRAEVPRDFSFNYRGQRVTCTVIGASSFEFDEHRTDVVFFATWLRDDDAVCREAIVSVTAGASIEVDGNPSTLSGSAYALGPETSGTIRVLDHAVLSMTASHGVLFRCDQPTTPQGCAFTFNTYPK